MSFYSKKPLIYLITKGETTIENFAEKSIETLAIIEKAVAHEINLIQIREKKLPAKFVYELAAKAARITRNSKTKLLVNDRADIAKAANADGVHLTSNSIAARIIRKNFGEQFIIGVSAHSLKDVETARDEGADFATFSPIYHSPGKCAPVGLEILREVCAQTKSFPVIALGGIDEKNFHEVLEIADGFAAIRFLNDVRNLQKLRFKE